MFGKPQHATGQPRPGGAINKGGTKDTGKHTSFRKPGQSTGTMKPRAIGMPTSLPASLRGLEGK